MWFTLLVSTVMLALTGGCTARTTPAPQPVTITISAAASLTESFSEIGQRFEEAHPGVSLIFNFAGSQELAQQISQGARVDVFASANQKQMDFVITASDFPGDAPVVFAHNRLVVIVPADNPASITDLADLANPGLKLVFAGAEVPVGQYSLDFLNRAEASGMFTPGFQQAVLDNIVSYENNVRAVLTKVSLGEADGGVVYATDAITAVGTVKILDIPPELNVTASYPILALPNAVQAEWGRAFVDFVLSDTGQQVLKKYGFTPVR